MTKKFDYKDVKLLITVKLDAPNLMGICHKISISTPELPKPYGYHKTFYTENHQLIHDVRVMEGEAKRWVDNKSYNEEKTTKALAELGFETSEGKAEGL